MPIVIFLKCGLLIKEFSFPVMFSLCNSYRCVLRMISLHTNLVADDRERNLLNQEPTFQKYQNGHHLLLLMQKYHHENTEFLELTTYSCGSYYL